LSRIELPNIKYKFTKYNGIFHRAWTINYGVKHISTGNILVLMDGDILLNDQWVNELKNKIRNKIVRPIISWSSMFYTDKKSTNKYLQTQEFEPVPHPTFGIQHPNIKKVIGGVTIIPRNIFYNVKGYPEDFRDTWGYEDNAFILKLLHSKYKLDFFNDTRLLHLYHEPTTVSNPKIQSKYTIMMTWDSKKWKKYINAIEIWGEDPKIKLLNFKTL
jgi:predicted glycosyltransferase involved in capsule biosynthesis